MLVFVAMNLKKLATWQWEHMSLYLLLYKNRQKYQSTLLVKRKLMLLSTALESGTIVFSPKENKSDFDS